MIIFRCVSVKQLLKFIKKTIKFDLFLVILVLSLLFKTQNPTQNPNTNFFDRWFTTLFYCGESLLSLHRYGHSVFTRRKIINKVFIMLFWDTIHCILLSKIYNPFVTLQGSGITNFSYVV